jgi:FKBP-type peptidyl-prolyl cis-trans isomerase SlyD
MRSLTYLASVLLLSFSLVCSASAKSPAAPVQDGKKVSLNYTLTVDGQVVDSTSEREPLTFTQGSGELMPGLGRGIAGLKPGEKKSITVRPAEAYGPVNPEAIVEIPKAQFPSNMNLNPGMTLQVGTNDGGQRMIRIVEVKNNSVVVDMNHPLAGKTLKFDVEILSVT